MVLYFCFQLFIVYIWKKVCNEIFLNVCSVISGGSIIGDLFCLFSLYNEYVLLL